MFSLFSFAAEGIAAKAARTMTNMSNPVRSALAEMGFFLSLAGKLLHVVLAAMFLLFSFAAEGIAAKAARTMTNMSNSVRSALAEMGFFLSLAGKFLHVVVVGFWCALRGFFRRSLCFSFS